MSSNQILFSSINAWKCLYYKYFQYLDIPVFKTNDVILKSPTFAKYVRRVTFKHKVNVYCIIKERSMYFFSLYLTDGRCEEF